MKTVALFCLLLATAIPTFAQHQKAPATARRQSPEMQGLGVFKINKTTTGQLAEIAAGYGRPIRVVRTSTELSFKYDSVAVYEIGTNADAVEEIPARTYCPGGRVYYLPKYMVSGVEITGLYLEFYNNLLVCILCNANSSLEETFAAKYGKPRTSTKTSVQHCVFVNTGNKMDRAETEERQEWYNGTIKALSYARRGFGRDCEPVSVAHFSVVDQSKKGLLLDCSARREDVIDAQVRAAKVRRQRASGI